MDADAVGSDEVEDRLVDDSDEDATLQLPPSELLRLKPVLEVVDPSREMLRKGVDTPLGTNCS